VATSSDAHVSLSNCIFIYSLAALACRMHEFDGQTIFCLKGQRSSWAVIGALRHIFLFCITFYVAKDVILLCDAFVYDNVSPRYDIYVTYLVIIFTNVLPLVHLGTKMNYA